MAARIAPRLRRADERPVRHGVALPTQDEHPLVDDVAQERGPRSRRRCGPGGGSRPTAGRRTRRLRAQGEERRAARPASLLLRAIVHHKKDVLSGLSLDFFSPL